MDSPHFTATLLRTSSMGFASMALSRVVERLGAARPLEAGFGAWQAQFNSLLLELAAAVDDESHEHFATKVGWTRDAMATREAALEVLALGLVEIEAVLKRELPPAAWDRLPAFFQAAGQELARSSAQASVSSATSGPQKAIVDGFLFELRQGNHASAIELVLAAMGAGQLSVPDALEGVLGCVMREIGSLWHRGEASVAEEHFVTQSCGRLLEQILLTAPRSASIGRSVMLTNVEGDAHDIGLRIIAAFFELDGWATICLGANTPAADLAHFAEKLDVDLVVLGATLNTQRDAVAETIKALRRARASQKILVGGPAFQGLEQRATLIGADACTLQPSAALQIARQLVGA